MQHGLGPRGFTLVEVLCAAAVFMVGLVGIMGLELAGTRQVQSAAHRERALEVGQNLLVLSSLLPPATLQGMTGGMTSSYDINGAAGGNFYTAVTTSTPQTVGNDLRYNVSVVVSWTEPRGLNAAGGTQQVRLER